jgi:hypothetical protein
MKAVKRSCFHISLLSILLTLALAAAPSAEAQARPSGPDRQLAAGSTWSAVALAADGGGALVWVARDAAGIEAVWTRPFAPDGTLLDPVTRVGDHRLDWDLSGRDRPDLGIAADGSWVVAWTAPRGAATVVQVRAFDPLGRPAGPAFAASGSAHAAGPRIAVGPDGDFAVAWTQAAEPASVADVWARRFARGATPAGEPFRVNGDTARRQEAGGVALAPDGSLAVAFDSVREAALQGDVLFALFAADGGSLVADRQVNGDPAFAAFDQWESAIARLADGRWLVAYRGMEQDGGNGGGAVVGRFLSAAGEPEGAERVLNGQPAGHQAEPAVAALPDGGFVALWSDRCDDFDRRPNAPDCTVPANHRDGHYAGIYGRFFAADGQPEGGDFRVNGGTAGHQFAPSVATSPGGHVAAGWTTNADRTWGSPTAAWWRPFAAPTAACDGDARRLCLGGGRFVAEVAWTDFQGGRGHGTAVRRDDGWGYFWFFDPGNVELSVKLLDGRAVNGHFWVFYGALSNVDYTLTITDTETGAARSYRNPAGRFASTGDTSAFTDAGAGAATGARAASTLGGQPASAAAAPSVAPPPPLAGACRPAPGRLCLEGGRFAADIRWQDPTGNQGWGGADSLTSDTGTFWFFTPDNPEVFVKLLDARAVNGRFWVFYGSLTNVAFTLTVTDTQTGEQAVYRNPQGQLASAGDTEAF